MALFSSECPSLLSLLMHFIMCGHRDSLKTGGSFEQLAPQCSETGQHRVLVAMHLGLREACLVSRLW